jgi:hypothetical protein
MENETSSVKQFDELAERVANQWYGGKLPNDPPIAAIVEVLLRTIPDAELPKVPAEVLEAAKRYFADCLLQALNDRLAAQQAAEKAGFPN